LLERFQKGVPEENLQVRERDVVPTEDSNISGYSRTCLKVHTTVRRGQSSCAKSAHPATSLFAVEDEDK